MTPIPIAIWGIGAHARKNLIPALMGFDGVEVVGVFSREESARGWAADELGCVAYSSPEELLADDTVAVYLATPPATHEPLGLQILSSGKHLWCEKPLSIGLSETERLVRTAEDAGLGVFEALMYRYHPQFAMVRSIIDSGTLGAIRSIEASFGIPHLDPSDHRYDPEAGGGAFSDAARYPVSLIDDLLHRSVDVVGAELACDEGYAVDTRGSALLSSEAVFGLAVWGFGFSYRNHAAVWGSDGRLEIPRAFSKPGSLETVLEIVRSDGTIESIEVPAENHFAAMFRQFADDVSNGTQSRHNSDSLRLAQLMQAIRNSATAP